MEAYQAVGSRFEKGGYYHLILLAMNEKGRKNLMRLSYHAAAEGFYRKPRIDNEVLRTLNSGIICLSACLAGEIPSKILKDDPEWVSEEGKQDDDGVGLEQTIEWYKSVFGDRYYLELQLNSIRAQELVNLKLLELHQSLDVPLVYTNDCHYTNQPDSILHEAIFAIRDNKLLSDPNRYKFSGEGYWVKTPEEIHNGVLAQVPSQYQHFFDQAIERTVEIADRCDALVPVGKHFFPAFEVKTTHEEELRTQCYKGLRSLGLDNTPVYVDQIEYELDVIIKMGFAPYFLVVSDFVNWAKINDIIVGPGRGSVAGSLLAYVLGITEVDPIKYGLYFERFINPDRVSLPDIDMDFSDRERHLILEYVRTKYGANSCANIATYGTMAAKGSVRSAGMILGMPQEIIDEAASLVPDDVRGKHAKLSNIMVLDHWSGEVKSIFKLAIQLEGLIRTRSVHASGFVVAPGHIADYVPVCRAKSGDLATEWDMTAVEDAGLVKFDFLGLRNLSVVKDTLALVKQRRNIDLDLTKIPTDDELTYKTVCDGNVLGIFQLEASSGIRQLAIDIQPKSILDWSAIVALFRPGPLDTILKDYLRRKKGEDPVTYPLGLTELKGVLEETYGLYVYQEQILKIAQVVSGYTLAEADLLRRAIGKKKPEEMAAQKDRFISGRKEGLSEKAVAELFDDIEVYADYCLTGNTTVVKLDKLRGGKTKSCGCLNLELSSLRAEKMYSKNRKYTPLEASARRVWQKRYGEMEFEDFYEMSQQNCYYCGESLINIQNCAGSKSSEEMKKNGVFIYNGLDRVDNNKPHSKENCVPCCKYCNFAKRDRTLEEFKQWAIKTYNYFCKDKNNNIDNN
jgi:DNA polymerase-3 subunit alpha